MALHCLDEQTALVTQPDRPGESGGSLSGDGLPFEVVRIHEKLGYLQVGLELSGTAARIGLWQAV